MPLTADDVTNLGDLPAIPLPIQLSDIFAIWRSGLSQPAYQGPVSQLFEAGGLGQLTVLEMNSAISAPYALVSGNICNLHSDAAPQIGNLPSLATAVGKLYIDIHDTGNNAGVNNGTINVAGGSDTILDYATSVTTKTLTLSNGVWRFVPVAAATPYWRVFSL